MLLTSLIPVRVVMRATLWALKDTMDSWMAAVSNVETLLGSDRKITAVHHWRGAVRAEE